MGTLAPRVGRASDMSAIDFYIDGSRRSNPGLEDNAEGSVSSIAHLGIQKIYL